MSDRVLQHVEDAHRLSVHAPAEAMNAARKAAEAMCWHLLPEESELPKGRSRGLHQLIETAAARKRLPPAIAVELGRIRAAGNRGSHASPTVDDISPDDVREVLEALGTALDWFCAVIRDEAAATATRQVTTVAIPSQAWTELPEPPQSRATAIVGRSAELELLRGLVDRIAAGSSGPSGIIGGRAVLLAGASGVGKTALADHALDHAHARRLRVVRTSCEAFHDGMSFYPVRECLRQITSPRGLAFDIGTAFGMTSSQVALARLADHPDAEPSARRDALVATFTNAVLARVKVDDVPIVLFIDDLERIDAGSADAIVCLLARAREERVCVLGAYRDDVVPASGASSHPLRPVIQTVRRADTSGEILGVGLLARDQVEDLVAGMLGGRCELPESFYRRLFEETDGNPLYIREALRTLSARRSEVDPPPLRLVDSSWRLVRQAESWEIPRSIDDAIASRLVSLPDMDRAVLELGAVIGRQFQFDALLDLGIADENAIIGALERHMKTELIRELRHPDPEGVFQFTHGKIREVLYNDISALRRGRLHGQVADLLLRRPELVPQEQRDLTIGTHLYAARRYGAAASHLVSAGERALEVFSAADAAQHLRRGLEAMERDPAKSPEQVDRTRLMLGVALKTASEVVAAERVLLEVEQQGSDAYARRWALNHLGDISLLQGRIAEAVKRYGECEGLCREANDEELLAEVAADLAELHMRQSEKLAGVDSQRATHHAEAYVQYLELEQQLAPRLHSHSARARAFRNAAKRERALGNLHDAIRLYEQSIAVADKGTHSHQFLIPYAKALRLVDRYDDAVAIVKQVLSWGIQVGAQRSEAIARQYLGLLLMEQRLKSVSPDFGEARAEMLHAVALHTEIGFDQGRRETEVDLAELCAHEGDRPEAIRHLRQVVAQDALEDEQLSDPGRLAAAVVSQLRANGEAVRAERVWNTFRLIGILAAHAAV